MTEGKNKAESKDHVSILQQAPLKETTSASVRPPLLLKCGLTVHQRPHSQRTMHGPQYRDPAKAVLWWPGFWKNVCKVGY